MIALAPIKPEGRSVEELLSNVSASRLSTWVQCRLKFFFRYIEAIPKPKSSSLHVGSVVHEVLKVWNKARWKNEHPNLEQLREVYSSAWAAEQDENPVSWEEDTEEEQRNLGWKLLEHYFGQTPIQRDEKPEAVEVSVEADLSHHGLPNLVGIIDLVRHGGRIVDFKTSGKTPDPEQARHTHEIQTTAYALLYRDSTSKMESGIELHHLIKTKTPKLVVTEIQPATEHQITRLLKTVDAYVSGLQGEEWIPSPGFACAGCEFFQECRNWH